MSISQAEYDKMLFEAQIITCMYCGTVSHQLQNIYNRQCCEKKLLDYTRCGYSLVRNPQIKNIIQPEVKHGD